MRLFLLTLMTIVAGCVSTSNKMNYVSVGMTKPEVVEVLGEPDETRASEGVEYMIYTLGTAPSAGTQAGCGMMALFTVGMSLAVPGCQTSENLYFVQLKEGKVSAYGRVGDFDSTKTPEATININKYVEHK